MAQLPSTPLAASANLSRRALQLLVGLLPVTAALGPYLLPIPVAGVNLFAFRVLAFVLFGLSLLAVRRFSWTADSVAAGYMLLGLLWMAWGGMGAMWAPDFLRAVVEVLALAFAFGTAFSVLQLQRGLDDILAPLRLGWVVAFVATAAIAVWELSTGNHLPSYRIEHVSAAAVRGVAMATFNNPNNFAAFLLLAFPFLYWSYRVTTSSVGRIVYGLLLLILPGLMVATASRLGALGFLFEVTSCWVIDRDGRKFMKVYTSVLVAGIAVIFVVLGPELRLALKVFRALEELDPSSSIAQRLDLTLSGLWFAFISGGLGVGPGAFEILIRRGSTPFDTGGLLNPHNFFIEVLGQYGVFVFLAFLAWLGHLTQQLLRLRRKAWRVGDPFSSSLATAICVGLAGYLPAAVANSTYMLQSTHWMFWVTVLAGVVALRRRLRLIDESSGFPSERVSGVSTSGEA